MTSPLRAVLHVTRYELRSALRDRQTLIYTVLLPLALYPALFWVMLQGWTFVRGRDEITEVRVDVCGETEAVPLPSLIHALEEEPEPSRDPGPVRAERIDLDPDEDSARARLEASDGPDAILALTGEGALVFHDATRSRSVLALSRVRERLGRLVEGLRAAAVERAGLDPAQLSAFTIEPRDLASERGLGAYVLSFILPLTFVIMAVMGAFYPAVDATAGEKERGTAETTLLLPVPRLSIQLGKVLAVAAGSLVATALNLIGLGLAAEHLLSGLEDVSIRIPWAELLAVLPLCGAFLFTTSAIMLALASFTDTFKQGQSLLGGVQLIFIVPAVVGIMPGVELTPGLALVPVVQTVLAFKTFLQGVGSEAATPAWLYALVFASQLGYAALAVWISVRLASRESLSFGGSSLRRILAVWRTEGTPR